MNQLGTVLAQIAQQLGLTAAHLWPQIVAVTFYKNLAQLVIDLFCLVIPTPLLVWCTARVWHFVDVVSSSDSVKAEQISELGSRVLGLALVSTIWVVIVIVLLLDLPTVLAGVFAPEGVAALDLLSRFTGK